MSKIVYETEPTEEVEKPGPRYVVLMRYTGDESFNSYRRSGDETNFLFLARYFAKRLEKEGYLVRIVDTRD